MGNINVSGGFTKKNDSVAFKYEVKDDGSLFSSKQEAHDYNAASRAAYRSLGDRRRVANATSLTGQDIYEYTGLNAAENADINRLALIKMELEKATSGEVITGADDQKYVTPFGVHAAVQQADAGLDGRIQTLEQNSDLVNYDILPNNPLKGKGFRLTADSIGAAQGASEQAKGYGYRVAAYIGGTFTNFSVPGDTFYNQLPKIMKSLPQPSRDYFAMCGLGANDIRSSNWNFFPAFVETFLVQHFSTIRTKSTDSSVRKSGTWVALNTVANSDVIARIANSDALASNQLGAYQEFDFTGTSVYVNILSTTSGQSMVLASYTISIDGVIVLTQNNYNALGGGDGFYNGASFTRLFNNLTPGSHTIRVTQNGDYGSAADRYLSIDFYGQLAPPQECIDVAFMEVPQIDTFFNANLTTHLNTKTVNAQLQDLETKWQNWGYKAWLVKHSIYIAANSVDGLHPNNQGHLQWFLETISLPCLA